MSQVNQNEGSKGPLLDSLGEWTLLLCMHFYGSFVWLCDVLLLDAHLILGAELNLAVSTDEQLNTICVWAHNKNYDRRLTLQ